MAVEMLSPEKLARLGWGLTYDQMDVALTLLRNSAVVQAPRIDGETVKVVRPALAPVHIRDWNFDRTTDGIPRTGLAETAHAIGGLKWIVNHTEIRSEDYATEGTAAVTLASQGSAIARGLNRVATDAIEDAEYEFVVNPTEEGSFWAAITRARFYLNRAQVPTTRRFMVVGDEFEFEMTNDATVKTVEYAGDAQASESFREAYITRAGGFTVMRSSGIDPKAAYAFDASGYGLGIATPSALATQKNAVHNESGIALRWALGGDIDNESDVSSLSLWAAAAALPDQLLLVDESGNESLSESSYFVRGVKLHLDEEGVVPEAGSELALATGVSATTEP